LDDDGGDEGVPSTAIREVSVLRELCMMADESEQAGRHDGGANIVKSVPLSAKVKQSPSQGVIYKQVVGRDTLGKQTRSCI